jgi:hypothetical protein
MVFNGEKKADDVHPKFYGTVLKRVKSMRYFGLILNEKLTNGDHINSRKQQAIIANIRLNKYWYCNKKMKPTLKSVLYKCFTRSVLLYGMENLKLRQKEIKTIQTQEAKLIKRSLQLAKRTHNTNLLYALDLDPIEQRHNNTKCKFMMRLQDNDYTKRLLTDLVEYYIDGYNYINKESMITEILDLLQIDTYDEDTIAPELLKIIAEVEIHKQEKQSDAIVGKIHELLVPNYNNEAIFDLIKVEKISRRNINTEKG